MSTIKEIRLPDFGWPEALPAIPLDEYENRMANTRTGWRIRLPG